MIHYFSSVWYLIIILFSKTIYIRHLFNHRSRGSTKLSWPRVLCEPVRRILNNNNSNINITICKYLYNNWVSYFVYYYYKRWRLRPEVRAMVLLSWKSLTVKIIYIGSSRMQKYISITCALCVYIKKINKNIIYRQGVQGVIDKLVYSLYV